MVITSRGEEKGVSDNAAVVRELFELGLSGGDTAVIDRLVSPEVTFAQPGVPRGREGLGLVVELDNDAFSGWRYELDDVLVDGDRVAVRWTARGRHENTYLGEGPTGRDVTQEGITILRLDGGVVVEVRSQPDSLGLLQQLGVLPTMSIVD
jgi:predicted ester cyclase